MRLLSIHHTVVYHVVLPNRQEEERSGGVASHSHGTTAHLHREQSSRAGGGRRDVQVSPAKYAVDTSGVVGTRTTVEKQQDENLQLDIAKRHLIDDVRLSPSVASGVLAELKPTDVTILNTSFPSVHSMFSSRFRAGYTTPTLFLDWFGEYKQDYLESKGYSGSQSRGIKQLISDVNELRKELPTATHLTELRKKIGESVGKLGGRMSVSQQVLVDKLDKIQSTLPSEATLKALDTNTVESYNAIRQ